MNIKNCTNDVDLFTQTPLNELDEEIVVFKYKDSVICMSKNELIKSWSDQYSLWRWGNCKDADGNPIDSDLLHDDYRSYCTKYYKLPHHNLYITEAMKESLKNSNIQVWTISKSGEKRNLFRDQYDNKIEENIYKICPEDNKDCDFIEDINRFNYDPIAAIQSLSPEDIAYLDNNLAINELYPALDDTHDHTMDESYDALRALADINDTEVESLAALEALAIVNN